MESKKCSRCKKTKHVSDFTKNISCDDGLFSYCRKCCSDYRKESHRTIGGLIRDIYSNQRSRSARRKWEAPAYTRKELHLFLSGQDKFHSIFNDWVKSNYNKDLIPSVDRINDYKYYTLDNISVTTWKQNNERAYSDRKNGINNKHSRAVRQLTLSGGRVAEYPSTRMAERKTGVGHSEISKCCSGKIEKTMGYKWEYC